MRTPSSITRLGAFEVLDSRGRPTVAAFLRLRGGLTATASVPSGASTGSHEAIELRDREARYGGLGVRTAIANIEGKLATAVVGLDVADPGAVDAALLEADRSPGFSDLGGNAILAVSIAAAKASAAVAGLSLARHYSGRGPLLLPMPMVNIISGGAHAGGLIDIQDLLVIPTAARSFGEAIELSGRVREATQRLALERGHREAVLVADEGGLGLALQSNRQALELLVAGIERAGLVPGDDVHIALDIAANELLKGSNYEFASEARSLSSSELVAEIGSWCQDFPIISVEDPLAEDDTGGWSHATEYLGQIVQLVGDDLFATNRERLSQGIRAGIANSVLVKVNQNGTLAGARGVLQLAQANDYRTVVSARSGETEESWLADLAVGWRAGQIKVGSTHRSERTAKWNRLLELEATEETEFAGPWTKGMNGRPTPPRGNHDE